ncbi:MAG TPA: type II toxin-antitoxin system RelE/ParE family toxin [Allosphingosinicella sp.]
MVAEVILSPEALDDLLAIYVYVAEAAGLAIADRYDGRIRATCSSLAIFPNRGTPHEELARGLRSIPIKGSATIFYRVSGGMVVHILPKGVDARQAFGAR